MFDAIDFKWNDEEKEAIKTLSIKAVTSKAECEDYPSCICLKKDLLLILKLIENQQKQIKKLKNQNKLASEEHEKRFNEFEAEIEKKDKIIDFMLEHIDPFRLPIEEKTTKSVKQYFEKKVKNKQDFE